MSKIMSQLRLVTGLFLALYVFLHLLNHAFGLLSIETAEAYRETIGLFYLSTPMLILFYASLISHAFNALYSIYRRDSLRLKLWQWLQLILGLSILPLLLGHIIGNRGYALLSDIDPNYFYVITSLARKPLVLAKLAALVLVLWVHMVIGLHYWQRLKPHYSRSLPYLYALVILVPTLAYAGLISMLQQATVWLTDESRLDQIYAGARSISHADLRFLQGLEDRLLLLLALLLLLTLVARQVRIWWQTHTGSYQIMRADGGITRAPQGTSLLEALHADRIPHAAVCGGRARCTTCRVRVGQGLDQLAEPDSLEAQALERISAKANVRLACQIRPTADLSITPLVLANQTLDETLHRGGVQGHEEYVVTMFVDMRGSTNLGERVLAYDVVFILNRFFTELSDALQLSHGHYAQFAGDGLMALYGLDQDRKHRACQDALDGASEMFRRIDTLNQQLQQEFGESIEMGIGIHGGEAIVGTMGPPKTPLLTAVGDHINIAARLEAQTKQQDCELIISIETLARESITINEAECKNLDVRGRDKNVAVYLLNRSHLPAIAKS